MTKIPVFLLKTRSQPDDGYEEQFARLRLNADNDAEPGSSSTTFEPRFVPVLEHQPNTANLSQLEHLLRTDTLADKYGGMIFTSQRAVEGFSDVVRRIDAERSQPAHPSSASTLNSSHAGPPPLTNPPQSSPRISPSTTTPFPLYVVGPATARSLSTLLHPHPSPTLRPLHPTILGAHTGNGSALASFMLAHYNTLHASLLFEYYEAPRLPFIPLVGPASGQYARQRMEKDDERIKKKPLLFLVGEVRRDVIPRTLMDAGIEEGRRVGVEEWEVYRTGVREGFEGEFGGLVGGGGKGVAEVVVVVFSPQGCEAMLRVLGCLGEDGRAKERFRRGRWRSDAENGGGGWVGGDEGLRFVVATIGPTTRDHLIDTFGFEPDVCATKPSPEGVSEGVAAFLRSHGIR